MRWPLLLSLLLPALAGAANDFSAAEQALFLGTPLATLRPPLTLGYTFRKTGTLEASFDDTCLLYTSDAADD